MDARESVTVTPRGKRTRSRIVGVAARLMLTQGVARTSLDEICVEAAVRKSQIYHYFRDKAALVQGVIDYQTERLLGFQEPMLSRISTWEQWHEWAQVIVDHQAAGHVGGCPLGSLASELADDDPRFRESLVAGFVRWRDAIGGAIERTRDAGLMPARSDVGQLAAFMLASLQGGLLLGQLQKDATSLRSCLFEAIRHLQNQVPMESGGHGPARWAGKSSATSDHSPANTHQAQGADHSLNDPGRKAASVSEDLDSLDLIREAIRSDPANAAATERGWLPLYVADVRARVVIIGQAPGLRAQESGVPWNDASGRTLVSWLGVTQEQFHDPSTFALIPMDFYFPGKGTNGDLPPRRGFAGRWHPPILRLLENLQVMILIGAYAQRYYLKGRARPNLTETVKAYKDYLPEIFPLVHPSPLNFRWRAKNPWFESVLLPDLRVRVKECIG